MRGALGNALLLNVIVIIVAIIIVFFTSILAYSKAYKVKNRIIEVIEKYSDYNSAAENEISSSLAQMGYQLGNCKVESNTQNNTGYRYCIQKNTTSGGSYYYKITTYIQFYFPVIEEFYNPPVYGETKVLGKNYDY